MFGYAVDRDGKVQIVNRIFEMCLYNYFLSEEELSSAIGNKAKRDKCYFIHDGMLDMDEVMKKFVEHFYEIYGNENMNFIEKFWTQNLPAVFKTDYQRNRELLH